MKEGFTGRMLWFSVYQPPSSVFSLSQVCSPKSKSTIILAIAAKPQQYLPFIIVLAWFETKLFPSVYVFD